MIPEAGLEPARLTASHFECDVSAIPPLGHNKYIVFVKMLEAATGIEPVVRVLQTHALPLGYAAVEEWSGRRDSNPRPRPWQGRILPLNYFRLNTGVAGFEPTMTESKSVALPLGYTPKVLMGRMRGIEPPNAGITIRCVNHFATTAIIELVHLVL